MNDLTPGNPAMAKRPPYARSRRDWAEQLYRLLPAVYQIRDAEERGMLAAYMRIIGEQVQMIEDDVAELYENWFVETCDDWVVPYLGDLVGYRRAPEAGAGEPGDAVTPRTELLNRFLYPRREIANLVRRRRRKGTLSVLEDVARDVTGWQTRAVEFSRQVAFFQHVRHPQPEMGRTLCVRDTAALARLNSPFDTVAHTVDVRAIRSQAGIGWCHPRKVGLFVWRRTIHSATSVVPCQICEVGEGKHVPSYTFNRLGQEAPLYVRPIEEIEAEHGIATEKNLPVPLYRHLLARSGDREQRACPTLYGLGSQTPKSLAISARWPDEKKSSLIPAARVHVCDLGTLEKRFSVAGGLRPRHVAVDPERGRFLFREHCQPAAVRVSYHLAATDDMGGGEYARPSVPEPQGHILRVAPEGESANNGPSHLLKCATAAQGDLTAEQNGGIGTVTGRPAIIQADSAADPSDCSRDRSQDPAPTPVWIVQESMCVELPDSRTFEIPAAESLQIAAGVRFEIRAARGAWPLIQIRAVNRQACANPWRVRLAPGAQFILTGLQVCGATIQVEDAGDTSLLTDGPVAPTAGECGLSSPLAVPTHPDRLRPTDHDRIERPSPAPAELHLRHTTLVPGGRAANVACDCQPNHASLNLRLTSGRVCIQHSILGTLNVEHVRRSGAQCSGGHSLNATGDNAPCPSTPLPIAIADSIIDAAAELPAIYANCCAPAHAELTVARSTILGDICVQQIARAEDSLFVGVVHVVRRGLGYMRFCYVPVSPEDLLPLSALRSSNRAVALTTQRQNLIMELNPFDAVNWCALPRLPQRFKCVPEAARRPENNSCSTGCGDAPARTEAQPHPVENLYPLFVSTRYGDPGYCELSLACPEAIRSGSEDESELGVFHDLYLPQRTAALRARLEEYTPAEMQSAVIFADDLNPSDRAMFQGSCCPKHD